MHLFSVCQEKAHKKNLYTFTAWATDVEEENIKKNICVSYIWKAVAACCN